MQPTTAEPLASLYESDETAWLEEMARLASERRVAELDLDHLAEFLTDTAKRERREVDSRLVVLLAHVLKWLNQADKRTGSWKATLDHQRYELGLMLDSGTLRNHAEEVLPKSYRVAVRQAATETGMPAAAFPAECPYAIDQLLADDFLAE